MGLRTDRGSRTSLSRALPERVSTGAALWGSLPEGKVCRASGNPSEAAGSTMGGGRIQDSPPLAKLNEEPEAWCPGLRDVRR